MSIDLRPLKLTDLPAARDLLTCACAHDQAAEVAEEKLFGAAPSGEGDGELGCEAFGAFSPEEMLGVVVSSGKWIRLFAVRPEVRGQGLGSVLLAAAESSIAAAGHAVARTLDQPGNYLAPGIDADNRETLDWMERQGYARCGENTNLLVDVADNPRVNPERARALAEKLRDSGYEIRRARAGERSTIGGAVARGFSPGWRFELLRALSGEPSGVHIALDRASGELAAFAVHDGNNRGLGWFGPAGTFEPHRRKGLGEALLLACLCDVARAGIDHCTIAWIGPRGFYQRVAGIAGERHFAVMEKPLTPSQPPAKATS